MIRFSNPTRERVHRRCPKRYQFRYLHPWPTGVDPYRDLFGLRELAGHLIHKHLAYEIRGVAAGELSFDAERAAKACLVEWDRTIAAAWAIPAGALPAGLHLAEMFNGTPPSAEDLGHWRDALPLLIENGIRAAIGFGIHAESTNHRVEVEQRHVSQGSGRLFNLVTDVVIHEPHRVVVIDWKCHEIANEDLSQVRRYLNFLLRHEGIPSTKLHGFAVDLWREQAVCVHFDPYEIQARRRSSSLHHVMESLSESTADRYPARPSNELCGSCPYLSVCADKKPSKQKDI